MTGPLDHDCQLTLRMRLTLDSDALARVLGVVLVAQSTIRSVSYLMQDDCAVSELEIGAISGQRADTIRRRLEGLACLLELEASAREAV